MLTGVKTGNDLNIEKLTTNLHMTPDGLKADNSWRSFPPLGNLTGLGAIDSKNRSRLQKWWQTSRTQRRACERGGRDKQPVPQAYWRPYGSNQGRRWWM